MKDFYQILGTDTQCTLNEIRAAYVKLSEKYHPALTQHNHYFSKQFKEINEAYEVLSDPVRRSRYDAALQKSRPNQYLQEKRKIKRYYSRAKGIDAAFTAILISLTLIFGIYVYRSVRSIKPIRPAATPVAVNVAAIPHIRHHQRRHTQIKTGSRFVKSDTAAATASALVSPKVIGGYHAQPVAVTAPVTAAAATAPIREDKASSTAGSLYTTYLNGNETGLIHLREESYFNSSILTDIPTGSRVAVLEKGSYYYKVAFGSATGYVPKWTLRDK